MKTYQLSATGRRNVMLLMIGAGLIWIFAIWTFQSTLAISYSPGKILDSLQASLGQGLTVDRTVPALFMLVLMVAAPLTIWNIAMEWVVRYTPTGDGLRYEAFGISLLIPWSNVSDIRAIDADAPVFWHEVFDQEDQAGDDRRRHHHDCREILEPPWPAWDASARGPRPLRRGSRTDRVPCPGGDGRA